MTRCGISRKDGVIRLGILCDNCAVRAMRKSQEEERRFWARTYVGPQTCEACFEDDDHLSANEGEQ